MANIVIEELSDEYDCETCGGSWATGYKVTIDDEQFGDFEPVAACYGGNDYSLKEVYEALLEHFGHTLEVN
jgi:hypothetical protein